MHEVPVTIFDDPVSLGQTLAQEILAGINQAANAKRPYLLGCPSGRTPQSTYRALGMLAASQGADLSRLTVVMMDEYVVSSGTTLVACSPDTHCSCRGFAMRGIRDVLNAGLPANRRVKTRNLWIPDPSDPDGYDRRIEEAGGIDLFLIASGGSDGHVAFNPPGSALDSRTRIIPLAHTTRADNMGTFPDFRSLDDVPRYGVGVGLNTIARLSLRVVMVITGEHKRLAAQRLASENAFNPAWPASIIYRCKHPGIYMDYAAAGDGFGTDALGA